MPAKIESGLTDHRTEFVRENTDANGDPVTPANPAWEAYADVVRTFEWEPPSVHQAQRGLSHVDPTDHHTGPEEHSITVVYDLQRWFEDANGNPADAAYDGIQRDAAGYLPNSHTVVNREDKTGIAESSTVDGTSGSRDSRIYTVGRGCYVDEAALTGDPGDQQPIAVELTYECERARSFKIDQPNASTTLLVTSTSADDTTQTVTIEDEGAATSEDVALSGTSMVETTSSFADIDAIELDAKTAGDVEVHVSDGTTTPASEALLAVLQGTNSHDNDGAYDLGVPATGTGSHAGAVGSNYEKILGDTFARGDGDLAMDVNSFGLTVSNNTERTPREDDSAQRIHSGTRNVEVSATVLGEAQSHGDIVSTLSNTGADIQWTLDGGSLTVVNARLTEPGSRTYEAEGAVMQLDNTFSGEGLTVA